MKIIVVILRLELDYDGRNSFHNNGTCRGWIDGDSHVTPIVYLHSSMDSNQSGELSMVINNGFYITFTRNPSSTSKTIEIK